MDPRPSFRDMDTDDVPAGSGAEGQPLWEGDQGTLPYDARRALLCLVRGPYISADSQAELWQALLNSQDAIQSRLNDLFLELVVDDVSRIAFVRNASPEALDIPHAVRTQKLNLTDTAMVLTLRRALVDAGLEQRVLISKDELMEQMAPYRPLTRYDEAGFARHLSASWTKLEGAGILLSTKTEGRWEISPVLKLAFGAEEVRAVQEELDALLADPEPMSDTLEDDDEEES